MSLAHNAPTCRNCTAPLPMGAPSCATCGHQTGAPAAAPYYPTAPQPAVAQPMVVVAAKSTGIAVLLTLLWLGAGHLYAGKIGAGVALMVFDFVLSLLAITGFGLIIAFPVWLVSVVVAAMLASSAVTAFNRRNGVLVH